MAVLYRRAGRLTAQTDGFRPGQTRTSRTRATSSTTARSPRRSCRRRTTSTRSCSSSARTPSASPTRSCSRWPSSSGTTGSRQVGPLLRAGRDEVQELQGWCAHSNAPLPPLPSFVCLFYPLCSLLSLCTRCMWGSLSLPLSLSTALSICLTHSASLTLSEGRAPAGEEALVASYQELKDDITAFFRGLDD